MTRRKFSREFKIEAVRLVTDRGVAVAQAARDLDVAESVLRRWMRELTATPAAAFPGNGQTRADLAEIAALKKEVARLRAERDILKKATAFSRGRCDGELLLLVEDRTNRPQGLPHTQRGPSRRVQLHRALLLLISTQN